MAVFSFSFVHLQNFRNMDEIISFCCLNRIFGFKPDHSRALVGKLGSASAVFALSSDELYALLPGEQQLRQQIGPELWDRTALELEQLEVQGIRFIPFTDPEFPPLLRETPNGPLGLYVRGHLPAPTRECIAVVGTRDLSSYGREWCAKITVSLARGETRPVIVSGMALGTDIIAHQTAVKAGLPTIGVLPCGPDCIYPGRHEAFGEAICNLPECGLVTDYPPMTPALPIHFLRRNRIIAGMAATTIVIESRIKGGSMITAKAAFDFNRDVYALPGRVDDPRSQGCNYLIRNNMAESIESLEELSESLEAARKFRKKTWTAQWEEECGCGAGKGSVDRTTLLLMSLKLHPEQTVGELALMTGQAESEVEKLVDSLEDGGFLTRDVLGRCMINAKKM